MCVRLRVLAGLRQEDHVELWLSPSRLTGTRIESTGAFCVISEVEN
jgi:hypothetical protein